MLLDVRNALKNPGQSYPLLAEIELSPVEVLDEVISFEGALLEGEIVGAGESVKIIGKCRSTVTAHCALCLEPVQVEVSAEVSEVFAKDPDANDPDQNPLDGYEIELADIAQGALLLELPMRFLCGADCKGLCPTCGTNQNTQRCTCQKGQGVKHPFSALSGLLNDNEEV